MTEEGVLSLRVADEGNWNLREQDHVETHDSKDREDKKRIQDDTTDWSKANVWNYTETGFAAQDVSCLKVEDARYPHSTADCDLNRDANNWASNWEGKRDRDNTTSHNSGDNSKCSAAHSIATIFDHFSFFFTVVLILNRNKRLASTILWIFWHYAAMTSSQINMIN